MNIEDLFKKVNELTSKFPNLERGEIEELRKLSSRLSRECADILYDMEVEKRNNKYGF